MRRSLALLAAAVAVFPTVLAAASTTASATLKQSMSITNFPIGGPTATTLDPYECYTGNLSTFFDVPRQPATLQTAVLQYASNSLYKSCTDAGTKIELCPFPPNAGWCGFTNAAPATLLPAWSTYASQASSWWSDHWQDAVTTAAMCPLQWYRASIPGKLWVLNETIAFAGCFDENQAQAQDSSSSTAAAPGASAVSSSHVSSTAKPSATSSPPSATPTKNLAARFANPADMAVVAGLGYAALLADGSF